MFMRGIIPLEKRVKFLSYLEKNLRCKILYVSDVLVHIKPSGHADNSGWIHVAQEKFECEKFNVLYEYKTCRQDVKFIFTGHYFINHLLEEKFGGCILQTLYPQWILYNEPAGGICNFGYLSDHLPAAKELITVIEDFYRAQQ